MIILPDNWRDTIRVIPHTHLLLAYVNTNREFFMYLMPLDRAFSLDEMVQRLAEGYPTGKAHTIMNNMQTDWLDEPTNQDWSPMPLADTRAVTLEQYKQQTRMSATDVTEGKEIKA